MRGNSISFYRNINIRTFLLVFLTSFQIFCQTSFQLPKDVNVDKIKFQTANNLMIIPVVLNGVELSFILDTGVGSTILFNLDDTKGIELNNVTKILIKGLGDDEPIKAVKSTRNILNIGKAQSYSHTVYMIFDESIDFSSQLGFPVHGIIGYDFFKNFIVDIKYSSNRIKFFKPDYFKYKNCKSCYQTDLNFENNKKRPLVSIEHKTSKGFKTINLLLDSGSSSAMWLFEDAEDDIKVPNKKFRDFLGKGFSGEVYGAKSRVEALRIGNYQLNQVNASFPDTLYTSEIANTRRQGSMGGALLKRFDLTIDYPNKKIRFKKNKFFGQPFYYNMSGITIEHTGTRIAREYTFKKGISRPSLEFISSSEAKINKSVVNAELTPYLFNLVASYTIANVRKGSPGDLAGLQKGDLVLKVNGRDSHRYSLSQLNDLFTSEEGKKIKIKVERLGVVFTRTFELKSVL